jgi:CheY-like chemotaxis protein
VAATVLVVEDDRSNRELISKVLRQDGHQVLETCDGAIALDMLQALSCDLVITDFVMPKLNGFKFVEQLHRVQPRLPVILITGYLSVILGKRILSNVVEILEKPFELGVLRSTVNRLIINSAAW